MTIDTRHILALAAAMLSGPPQEPIVYRLSRNKKLAPVHSGKNRDKVKAARKQRRNKK